MIPMLIFFFLPDNASVHEP